MVWTSPSTYAVGEMVTHTNLNAQVRDNLLALDQHAHGGAAGAGDSNLSGLDTMDFDDQAASPAQARRLQANGTDLYWGALGFNLTAIDAAAATLSLRKLGTGALNGAAGDHTHDPS